MIGSFGQGWMVHVLGWTLLHFVWQGLAVAALLWCVLGLMEGRAARMRYGAACCALGLVALAPVVTFWQLAAAARLAGDAGGLQAVEWVISVVPGAGGNAHWMERLAVWLDAAAPWVPYVWMVGVVVFLARLNVGLVMARRMKTEETVPVAHELWARFERLRDRVGVRRVVRIVHSVRVEVPTVIGWLRPVVLLPVAGLAGLSMDQVEALLAHELAHIRRHDYLVSVLQSVVEAVLFYHPAVWWISRQVRLERECRCDEVAVEAGGDALEYAKALSFLEGRRAMQPDLALGANGGVLTMRIKRMLGYRESSVVSQGVALAVLVMAIAAPAGYLVTAAHAERGVAAAAAAPAVVVPQVAVQEGMAGLREAYRLWLNEDVIWIIAPAERSAFLRLTSDVERDHFIAQFWERRNPEPGGVNAFRAEHYRRIAYANEHFGAGVAGWKMDRGHAYIAYGRPESIDSHPASELPYEVWHYQSGDMEFVDSCQCGEYRLKPQPGMSGMRGGSGSVKPASYVVRQEQVGPVRTAGGVMAGQLLSRVDPVYPSLAKEQRIQGAVVLKAVISKSGTVENLEVMSGPEELRASAIDAVRQWVYKPYLLNGEPTEVDTTITVNYVAGDSGDGASGSSGMKVAAGEMVGNLLTRVNPVYPEIAKASGTEGAVVLKAVISKEGRVENLQIVSGPSMLRSSALDAVRQWVYKPYLLNGEPTEVETTITVNYSLGVASSVGPKKVGNGISAPVPVKMPDPSYTDAARKAKVSGVVLVSFWVDEKGDPTHVRVVRGIGNGLDEKAVETVSKYKFKPAMEHGKPVTVAMSVEVDFKMF